MLQSTWQIPRTGWRSEVRQYTDENGEAASLTGHTVTASCRDGRAFDATLVFDVDVVFVDQSVGTYYLAVVEADADDLDESYGAGWGQVFVEGPSTDNEPRQVEEANPVAVF